MRIKFKRDTSFRKQFFVPDSFAHPAKMDAQLLIWIVEHYSQEGETILDPMAGSGTTMLACTLGRNVILVELEEKFCKMMRDNWEQVKMRPQLGSTMGTCEIIQGDARQLEGLVDKIVSSPPYSDMSMGGGLNTKPPREGHNDQAGRSPTSPSQEGAGGYVDKIVTSPPYAESASGKDGGGIDWNAKGFQTGSKIGMPAEYSSNPNNIGNLPYGEIDKCIFSPPFSTANPRDKYHFDDGYVADMMSRSYVQGKTSDPDNISLLPYGQIDKIVTSPPYGNPRDIDEKSEQEYEDKRLGEEDKQHGRTQFRGRYEVDSIITSPPYEAAVSASTGGERDMSSARQREKRLRDKGYDPKMYQGGVGRNLEVDFQYTKDKDNIGNLKSQSYLEAMLQVYHSCYSVLKPQGLMILVTKNFIRNKQVVRLDTDTIKLCEQAGFSFIERHERVLPSQSFWRVIYHQKHPEVEQIKSEDILVFKKCLN